METYFVWSAAISFSFNSNRSFKASTDSSSIVSVTGEDADDCVSDADIFLGELTEVTKVAGWIGVLFKFVLETSFKRLRWRSIRG